MAWLSYLGGAEIFLAQNPEGSWIWSEAKVSSACWGLPPQSRLARAARSLLREVDDLPQELRTAIEAPLHE